MQHVDNYRAISRLRSLWARTLSLVALLMLSACGFVIQSVDDLSGNHDKAPGLLNVPIHPVYLSVNDSYLQASGSCEGWSVIKFKYSSSLTSTQDVLAECINNQVSAKLPVEQGNRAQVFHVSVIGYVHNPQNTLNLPPQITVNYNPPTKFLGGMGITSGGGYASGTGIKVFNQAVGEVFTGTQTSASVTGRNGLTGAVDP